MYLTFTENDASDKFKIYKTLSSLQLDSKIKTLTYKGSEYYNPLYFESSGIVYGTTVVNTPSS